MARWWIDGLQCKGTLGAVWGQGDLSICQSTLHIVVCAELEPVTLWFPKPSPNRHYLPIICHWHLFVCAVIETLAFITECLL